MKKTTIASLMATAMVLPQLASGAIILAGWHAFTPQTVDSPITSPANEGITGLFNNPATFVSHRQASATGGSTDNWYGPDSTASGGVVTQQTPFNTQGVYLAETTNPGGPRLNPTYPTIDPFVTTPAYAAQPGTTMDGRIASTNGVDLQIVNGTNTTYFLQSFVFDAFLGDASAIDATAAFGQFVITITPAVGTPVSVNILPSIGYTGFNTKASPLTPLNTPFGPSGGEITVPNTIDYGTGTNYVDYVVNLGGLAFAPGSKVSFGFNQTGTGTVRLDNLALFAVPEPSSVMTLAALVGTGCFFRRRKQAV